MWCCLGGFASEQNNPTVEGLRSDLEKGVRNDKKAEQLKSILTAKSGDLSTMTNEINKENPNYAKFNNVNDAQLGMRYIPSFQFGFEPTMLGTAFGLNEGQTSPVIVGESPHSISLSLSSNSFSNFLIN